MPKSNSKIFWWLGGAALVGGAFAAWRYKAAAEQLQFEIVQPVIDQNGIGVLVKVTNPSTWAGFPVPRVTARLYDSNNTFLGTISNYTPQWLPPYQISWLRLYAEPNMNVLQGLLTSFMGGQLPGDIRIEGEVHIKNFDIPFGTSVAVSGIGAARITEEEVSGNEYVQRALHDRLLDMGHFSKRDKALLNKAVQWGWLVKYQFSDMWFGRRTAYAHPDWIPM